MTLWELTGGLLICLPREQAAKYCAEIKKVEGHQAWIIGIVEPGDRSARVIDKPRVIEVQTLEDGTVQSVPPVTTPRRTSHVSSGNISLNIRILYLFIFRLK